MWGGALNNWPTEHWGLNEKRDPRQIGKVHETMRPRALGGGGSTKNCVHEHEAVGKAHLLTMKKGTPDAINSALVKWMPRIEKWEAFSSASDSFRTKSKPPPNRPTANRHHTDPKPTPTKTKPTLNRRHTESRNLSTVDNGSIPIVVTVRLAPKCTMRQRNNMHQGSKAPMHQCINAPRHQCTNAPMHQYTVRP